MANEELSKAVLKAATATEDGKKRLACAKAFALAGKMEFTLAEIARFCNQNNIKITSCQLGCFK